MTQLLDPAERSARGLAVQAHVTGQPAPAPASLLDESWRDFIYAEVWSRPGLSPRARYLISIASAAMCDADDRQLDDYVRGALKGKELSLSELREAALHLAVYGGWSRGGALDRAISRAAQTLGLPAAKTAPIRGEPWDPQERFAKGTQEFINIMTFGGPQPDQPFFEGGILNFVFGEMWHRDGLDEPSRRWITLVGVCESAAEIPIKSHIYAAMKSGNCTPEELGEFVLQYAIHAGWPKASVVQGAVLDQAARIAAGKHFMG